MTHGEAFLALGACRDRIVSSQSVRKLLGPADQEGKLNIIALAQAGERDPECLCEAALKAVRPPDPLAGIAAG
jgi:hypothetical protein